MATMAAMTAGSSGMGAEVADEVYISDARTRSATADSAPSVRQRGAQAAVEQVHRDAESRRQPARLAGSAGGSACPTPKAAIVARARESAPAGGSER